ncbi:ATP-binding protein [Chitinophaga sedimenti]|uniref:ATP-binding protein n=1 Tax=Chitinophaga sedimenti TaxID=2033606 RepID=UPI002004A6CA|nr:ATP-binding protein [Chitinophaga sedimenti]MCK7559363.1 ATP-binding protein [Chitinophaga sedimenti]
MLKKNANPSETLERLRILKLSGMANTYEAFVGKPIHEQPGSHDMLSAMVDQEINSKKNARTDMLVRMAKIRYTIFPEQIHCGPERNLHADQWQLLCQGSI